MRATRTTSTTSRVSRMAACLALALAIGATGAVTSAASAAPAPVDPSTLNPAPPDFFNATCTSNGQNIICDLHFTDPPTTNEPIGLVCDSPTGSFEVLDTSTRSVVGKRFYGADGNLLRRHFRDDIVGTLTNSATGSAVTYVQSDRIVHDLTVPGDANSGSEEIASRLRVVSADGSTVFVDAGRTIITEADGTIEFSAGPHRFDDFFVNGDTAALQPLCDALA